MDPKLFISVLTPLLTLALSAAFGILWLLRPRPIYGGQLALAFLLVSTSFLLQSFDLGLGAATARFCSNLLITGALILLLDTLLRRRGLTAPLGLMGVIGTITMVGMGWFIWVDEDFYARVVIMSAGLGLLSLTGAISLYKAGSPTSVDRAILIVTALSILYFFARPIVEFLLADAGARTPDILAPYWLTTNLATILYCLLVALTMLTAVAMDAMADLQAQTQTDSLSGLLNRRGFEVQGEKLLRLYCASDRPLSLVMADLDHFKTVNDQHGHARGDQVIADFARRLRLTMGADAIAGRLGGEEFAVLLPQADLSVALSFAETVRASEREAGAIRVTASFGVAEQQVSESLEHLLERCDTALYAAKRDGRDCVRVADSPFGQLALRRSQMLRQVG